MEKKIELTQKEKNLLDLFGHPKVQLQNGTTLIFHRCGEDDITEIRKMSDIDLLTTAFSYELQIDDGAYSVGDLQYMALLWAEAERRNIEEDDDVYIEALQWYEEAQQYNEDQCEDAENELSIEE